MTTPHNPDKLTPEQVGVSEGWRLLDAGEYVPIPELIAKEHIQVWTGSSWAPFCSSWFTHHTYRTKLSRSEARGLPPEPVNPQSNRRVHELKTDSAVFKAVKSGAKTYELRKDDRGFEVGDGLLLKETRYTGEEMRAGAPLVYTGDEETRGVSHILRGPVYGLAEGWAILAFNPQPGSEVKTCQPSVRQAVEATLQQFFTDSLTPDRGYSLPTEHVEGLLKDATAQIARLTEERDALKAENTGLREAISEQEEEVKAADRRAEEARAERDQLKQRVAELEAEVARLGSLLCSTCGGSGVLPTTGQTPENFEYGSPCPECAAYTHRAESAEKQRADDRAKRERLEKCIAGRVGWDKGHEWIVDDGQ